MSDRPNLRVAGENDRPPLRDPVFGRQPGETAKAFGAFVAYRELGSARSYAKVVEAMGKPRGYVGQIERWASAWSWRVRAVAYDEDMDEIRRKANASAIEDMSARHVTETLDQQRIVMMPVREMIRRIDAGEADLSDMKLEELLRLSRLMTYGYSAAARMERLARGLSERGMDELADDAAAAEEERARIAELHGESVAQIVVLVLGAPELALPPEKQEIARRLVGRHLRDLAAGE